MHSQRSWQIQGAFTQSAQAGRRQAEQPCPANRAQSAKVFENGRKAYRESNEGILWYLTRKRSPADVRLSLSEARLTSSPEQEKAAADWLLENGWATEVASCASCRSRNLTDLLFEDNRPASWRCRKCGQRLRFLAQTIFDGLRCSLERVKTLLQKYAALSLTIRPAIADLVQASNLGHSTCKHFVDCLTELEATAGRKLCQKGTLRGRVEVDATFVTSYPVSKSNVHHLQEIQDLEEKRSRKGLPEAKHYKAHVCVLGAQTRGSAPLIHCPAPVITPIGERLVKIVVKVFRFVSAAAVRMSCDIVCFISSIKTAVDRRCPTESLLQVTSSHLLNKIKHRKGSLAWN